MNSTNMLCANKVKLHGMTSKKWTTADKIVQYKGLINLYTRDKKIIEVDNAVATKKQTKELKMLQRDIEINRKKLENAIGGDKQKLRNTLANHRELQLTFQNSGPRKVQEHVHQANFSKRKYRDIFTYKMKLKSEELIHLKLLCAELEDSLTYNAIQPMLPCEIKAHLITGKVQDAILKKEAAIYIRNAYKNIIAIMKKDAIYFDAILLTLKNDGLSQGKCLIAATKLGQIGTENLDDRRKEFFFLERLVKMDMVHRKQDLTAFQLNVEHFSENLKQLIRHDSDNNLGKIHLETTHSYNVLSEEISTIQDTLKILKDAFFTASEEQLYPFLREQVRQKERLTSLLERAETSRDTLLRNNKHAKVEESELKNTMVDTTTMYNITKIELGKKIEEQRELKKNIQTLINSRYALLAKVRISLKHFQYLSTLLTTITTTTNNPAYVLPIFSKREVQEPEIEEVDGIKIIPELTSKFAKLANSYKDTSPGDLTDKGYRSFELLMRERNTVVEVSGKASEESLIESVFLDARVPTRDDIKKQSEEVVARALAQLVYKPPPAPKKKYKFKK